LTKYRTMPNTNKAIPFSFRSPLKLNGPLPLPLPCPLPQPPFPVDVEKRRARDAEANCGVEAKMALVVSKSGRNEVPIERKVEPRDNEEGEEEEDEEEEEEKEEE